MDWGAVGGWIKDNAGAGTALVGSLLTGNAPAAVAAGVALVSSATGSSDPQEALEALQTDPETLVKLKELALKNEVSIRNHIYRMEKARLEDEQKSHETTQKTIISGDNSDDVVVRRTRPIQSWCSLIAAIIYSFTEEPDIMILGALLTLPWAYAGLRQIGKGVDSISSAVALRKNK